MNDVLLKALPQRGESKWGLFEGVLLRDKVNFAFLIILLPRGRERQGCDPPSTPTALWAPHHLFNTIWGPLGSTGFGLLLALGAVAAIDLLN